MTSNLNLNGLFARVREWNKRSGHMPRSDYDATLKWINDEEYRNRAMDLLTEEVGEMKEAIDEMNQVEMLDAAADIIFVLAGIIEKAGLGEYMEETMLEVLRSNDTKVAPNGDVVLDENGKIGKPASYRPPNIWAVMWRVDAQAAEDRQLSNAEVW